MNKFLILLILTCCSYLKSFGQAQSFNLKYAEIFEDKKLIAEGNAEGQTFIIDERLGRIMHLVNSNRSKDRIYKINSAEAAEKNQYVRIYTCEIPVTGGVAPFAIYINTFYKTIRVMPYQGNEQGLATYFDFQYK
jgi:hypothetical protein